MSGKPKLESKYAVVIPTKDWANLSAFQRKMISEIIHDIDESRIAEGSNPLSKNRYIICNQDEPYAPQVWDIILEGENKKLEDGHR